MLTINDNLKYRVKNQLHTWCHCWKVERTDGTITRFTDCDRKLTVTISAGSNKVFTPLGGFNTSAQQKELGLQDRNMEIIGAISTDGATFDDLRAGKYREAEVIEYTVDWMYPWAGPIRAPRYWIVRMRFDGEQWRADVEGLTRWLRQKRGHLYTRDCRWFLGRDDSGVLSSTSGRGCRYDVVANTEYNLEVNTIVTQRRRFTIVTSLTDDSGHFNFGRIVWVSGDNAGVEGSIRYYVKPSTFEVIEPTPFDIAATDHFHVEPGCDGRFTTCDTKFSNPDNAGSWPHIPGSDKSARTPKGIQ